MAEPDDASQVDALLDARPRSRARRWISIALLLLALGVAGRLLLRFLEGNTTPYYMAPIIRADLRPQLTIKGQAHLVGEITVRAPRDAMITALPMALGATVASGQALAVVDTSAFAQAMGADRLTLAAAHDQLARAFVDSRLASARLARYDKVWRESNHRVPSLDEMDAARAAARSAALAVRRDRALLDAAQRRLEDDMADLQAALPRAPIDGVVVQWLVAPGSRVQAGQPLLEMAPLGAPARVVVPLPPGIGPLPAGQPARVVIAGIDGAERDATLLRTGTDPAGVRQAVFALAPDPRIPPAAAATLKMTLPVRHHVLLAPNAALAFAPHCSTQPELERSSLCLLDRDGTARSVDIIAGPSDGQRTQILGGPVRPGQLAIIGWREAPDASASKPRSSGP
ncbi:MAG: HlyD family efflux transporter periplasmic adaptor subunit [Thiomonas sp.]|nr:HlyD family efflux transporter periplasmic adaptor subunit [Thiomonas sp.]